MLYHGYREFNAAFICILLLFIDKGESQIVCPNVAQLGYPASLTCIVSSGSDNIYLTPKNQTATTCFSNIAPCETSSQFGRFSGTVINTTHSNLTINETRISDEGKWICEDTRNKTESNCTLVLGKTPSCNITSDRNMDELDTKDNITLYVDIHDHYCSVPAVFKLQAGEQTVELKNRSTVFTSTFTLTESYLGHVKLLFTCNQITKTVSCGNIQLQVFSLRKSDPDLKEADQDKWVTIIAGTIAVLIFFTAIIILIWYYVKTRIKCKNDSNERHYSAGLQRINLYEGYAEVRDLIVGSFGNLDIEGEYQVPDLGYASVEEIAKERLKSDESLPA